MSDTTATLPAFVSDADASKNFDDNVRSALHILGDNAVFKDEVSASTFHLLIDNLDENAATILAKAEPIALTNQRPTDPRIDAIVAENEALKAQNNLILSKLDLLLNPATDAVTIAANDAAAAESVAATPTAVAVEPTS